MGKKKGCREERKEDSHLALDADFNQYLREISKGLENEVGDDEGRQMMINNFIEAIPEGREEAVMRHGLGSKVLEQLIGFSSPENFEKMTKSMQSTELFSDAKASFVMEVSLKIAVVRALCRNGVTQDEREPASKKSRFVKKSTDIEYSMATDYKVEHKEYCKAFVSQIFNTAVDQQNIDALLHSNQGNHLLRTCVLSLAGIVSTKQVQDRGPPTQINLKSDRGAVIDAEWIEMMCELSSSVLEWPHFSELAFDEKTSTFLQTLLQALHNIDQSHALKKLTKAIMSSLKNDTNGASDEEEQTEKQGDSVSDIEKMKPFSCKPAQFLLETVIQFSEEKQFNKIYKRYFKSHLLAMCDSNFNFTVQRLIDFTKNKEIFEEIFNQIAPQTATLLQNGRTGVVLALCKACDRLSFKQGQFTQSLLKALECERSQGYIIQCIVTLMPLHVVEKKTDIEVHLHGSLILQHILRFNKPIKIVQNLLDMKPQHLADIFCHPKGSRIADAFIESKFIGEKSREKLIKHLEGMYLKMAMSKNGSHVLEKFYHLSGEGQKEVVVKELAERTNQLTSSPSGKIIAYKFNVDAYARNPNQWRNFLARSANSSKSTN